MHIKPVLAILGGILAPHGYSQAGKVWRRLCFPYWDIMELQVSIPDQKCTLNIGVLDCEIFPVVWRRDVPFLPNEADCTVRVRIGELCDGWDMWWPTGAFDELSVFAEKVATKVIPFIDRMHSQQAMRDHLREKSPQRRYPPPIISLAVLEHRLGNHIAACNILFELLRDSPGQAWPKLISEVSSEIGCL